MTALTPRQQQILDVFKEVGSIQGTAKALGLSRSTVRSQWRAIEKKGFAPYLEKVPVPDHLRMTHTTVHYKGGDVEQEWRRLAPGVEEMEAFVEGLCERVKGMSKVPKRRPRKTDTDDLLFELDIYDPHVGMYADELETLDKDYNCKIAGKRMMDATWDLCNRVAPLRPKRAVVVFGGDILHSDTRNNETERGKNKLDVDSRYDRVQDYAIEACTNTVRVAATVAEEVYVVVVEGNHDWHSCKWMARVLKAHFSNSPNVTVVIQRSELKYMMWGENLLCWAHGDKIKPEKWQGIVSTNLWKEWGQCPYRYLRLGHIHHQKAFFPIQIAEQQGLVVEYLPALAATDAWHGGMGFVGNQKGASGFIYEKSKGLRDRLYYNV